MSSSLSSNDNSAASDSLARASYYASTTPQQQQPYSNNNNNINHNHIVHQNQALNNYPNRNNNSNLNSNNHHNQYQQQQQHHQPLSNIFPSIYNDVAGNNYMSSNLQHLMSSTNSHQPGGGGSSGAQFSSVQKQIQQDWSNREYIEVILSNIKKITDFLNTFDLSCRSKLAILDEKLTKLEREIDFVEARVTKGETLN